MRISSVLKIPAGILVTLTFIVTTGVAVAAPPPPPPPPPPAPPAVFNGCTPTSLPFSSNKGTPCAAVVATQAAMVAVGRAMFNDTALSASGKQSCSTCHVAGNAFTAGNNAPVPFGGVQMNVQGLRNTPTLLYAGYTPRFLLNSPVPLTPPAGTTQLHPAGGFMHDGRLDSLAIQAQQPFITTFEMANADSAEVEQRLKSRPYLAQFTAIFGTGVLNNPDATLAAMGQAIAAFESNDPGFRPFSSKYDAFIKGTATLTAQESAGLAAFSSRAKGNCISCHTTASPANALFTNFSYHALGVPRNWNIVYNLDSTTLPAFVTANGVGLGQPNHNYYDLGLCGPLRTDLASNSALCGSFKVPGLRNVGLKQTYFHNGVFSNLGDVVSWYATRNSNPSHWYTKADGTPDILYNDLPVAYDRNVAPVNAPGKPIAPNLNDVDIINVVSFLCTLTDGFDPNNPSAYNTSGQCKGL